MIAFTAFIFLLCLVHGTIENTIDEHNTVFKYTVDRIKEGDKSDDTQCNVANHTFYKDGNFKECIATTADIGEQIIQAVARKCSLKKLFLKIS